MFPVEFGLAQHDFGAAVGGGDAQHAAQRLDHRGLADQRCDAARRVAARLDLAAVGVEDAHLHVCTCGWFEQDQLVAPDAVAAVGDRMRARRRHFDAVLARVDHDKVVAEAVHLGEAVCHSPRM